MLAAAPCCVFYRRAREPISPAGVPARTPLLPAAGSVPLRSAPGPPLRPPGKFSKGLHLFAVTAKRSQTGPEDEFSPLSLFSMLIVALFEELSKESEL